MGIKEKDYIEALIKDLILEMGLKNMKKSNLVTLKNYKLKLGDVYNWDNVSIRGDLSEEFVIEFKDRMQLFYVFLCNNANFSEKFILDNIRLFEESYEYIIRLSMLYRVELRHRKIMVKHSMVEGDSKCPDCVYGLKTEFIGVEKRYEICKKCEGYGKLSWLKKITK